MVGRTLGGSVKDAMTGRSAKCVAIGVGLGAALLYLSVLCMGAGHGTYRPACLFFGPLAVFRYSCFLLAGPVLYGVYAWFLFRNKQRGNGKRAILVLMTVHYASVALAQLIWTEDVKYLRKTWEHLPVVLILGIALFLLGNVAAVWFKVRLVSALSCMKCGYDLTGNVSGVCPECGIALSIDQKAQITRAKKRTGRFTTCL